MEYILIILYALFLVWLYHFIMRRMKHLSYEHMDNTWLETLWRGYTIIRKRLIIIVFFLFFISSFLILTFFHNDVFFEVWLHDNKKTLDNASF